MFVAGRGNLGRTLATAFNAAGHPALLTPARKGLPNLVRSLESLPNAIVFLAVPDDALSGVAGRLAEAGGRIPGTVAFVHLSGAQGLSALDALGAEHAVGSFHPLQSFPEPRPPASLRGVVVGIDSSSPALLRRLAALARALGGRPRRVLDADRALYHAAAVFASNYVDVLLAIAVKLLQHAGWGEKEAIAGLLLLTEGMLTTVHKRGPVRALTGPVRRGDVNTVESHLAALAEITGRVRSRKAPPVVDQYRMLGSIALEIAAEAGLEPAAVERMHRALTHQVAATRRRRGQ
ncbi:MAG: DUF2520 domain-containing protein [Candidatus Dormibacteraceae bacterium]